MDFGGTLRWYFVEKPNWKSNCFRNYLIISVYYLSCASTNIFLIIISLSLEEVSSQSIIAEIACLFQWFFCWEIEKLQTSFLFLGSVYVWFMMITILVASFCTLATRTNALVQKIPLMMSAKHSSSSMAKDLVTLSIMIMQKKMEIGILNLVSIDMKVFSMVRGICNIIFRLTIIGFFPYRWFRLYSETSLYWFSFI